MRILLLSVLLTGCITTGQRDVYICDSNTAYRYHLKARCRGLSNCRHAIVITSKEEAEEKGRTLCKWER